MMYDAFIDEAYREVRENGTAQQRRFFDQHAASRREAAEFEAHSEHFSRTSPTIHSKPDALRGDRRQLRLAPVIIINTDFGGDNHQDAGLISETNQTLATIAALDTYWKSIHELNVAEDVLFATLMCSGVTRARMVRRGHRGDFVSGLMVGTTSRAVSSVAGKW